MRALKHQISAPIISAQSHTQKRIVGRAAEFPLQIKWIESDENNNK